jgi:phosphatidylglycerol:prolipoprotein diacylglycerol transferase
MDGEAMYPTISIGALEIQVYALMLVLALATLAGGIIGRARRTPWARALSPSQLVEAIFYVILAGLGGAWLLGTLPHWAGRLLGAASSASLLDGDIRWPGALAGAVLAWCILARVRRYPIGAGLDLAAPLLPLTLAIVRVGCVSAGCCWGRPADAWPAMLLPDAYGQWAWRYPTQFVSLGVNLLLCGALLALERWSGRARWRFAGALFLVYLFVFGVQDFLFGFWRADLPTIAGALTWNQVYDLLGVAVAAALFIRHAWRTRQGGER